MFDKKPNQIPRSTKHGGIQKTPNRVASRMEGVVKNAGTKAQKKAPKNRP